MSARATPPLPAPPLSAPSLTIRAAPPDAELWRLVALDARGKLSGKDADRLSRMLAAKEKEAS